MKIAIEGCAHGQLNKIYSLLQPKTELLVICGDFQALRSKSDLKYINVPDKYKSLGDFHLYYSGARKAPVPTIFIGGNHEDSKFLDQFPYGGYVAPNIYFMGRSNVVWFKGLRIGGISGIYNEADFMQPHPIEYDFEKNWSVRKSYHLRKQDYLNLRLLQPDQNLMMVSHDWPEGIYEFGDKRQLINKKRHFKNDIKNHQLGNPYGMHLLNHLKPMRWFSAHLHVKFDAKIDWRKRRLSDERLANSKRVKLDEVEGEKITNNDEIELDLSDDDSSADVPLSAASAAEITGKLPSEPVGPNHKTFFLSLDKCIREKDCFLTMNIPVDESHYSYKKNGIHLDKEFVSILKTVPKYREELSVLSKEELESPPNTLFSRIQDDISLTEKTLEDTQMKVPFFSPSMQNSEGKEVNKQTQRIRELYGLP